jgi:hypothetical protein
MDVDAARAPADGDHPKPDAYGIDVAEERIRYYRRTMGCVVGEVEMAWYRPGRSLA